MKNPVIYGLYGWIPAYGYRYVHPANRRTLEWLEPVGKMFEKIDETDDWIMLRYDEQQFRVSAELFKELPRKPPLQLRRLGSGSYARPRPAPAPRPDFGRVLGRAHRNRHLPAGRAQAQGEARVSGRGAAGRLSRLSRRLPQPYRNAHHQRHHGQPDQQQVEREGQLPPRIEAHPAGGHDGH